MTTNNSHSLYDEILQNWNDGAAQSVMRDVRSAIESGAILDCYFPSIRELSVVIPRRRKSCENRGAMVFGFDALIERLRSDHEDGVLKSIYLGNSKFFFQIFFEVNSMSFVGCLYGGQEDGGAKK